MQLTRLPEDIAHVGARRGVVTQVLAKTSWAAAHGRKIRLAEWEFILICDASRWEQQDGPLWLWHDPTFALTPFVRERLGSGSRFAGRDNAHSFCR